MAARAALTSKTRHRSTPGSTHQLALPAAWWSDRTRARACGVSSSPIALSSARGGRGQRRACLESATGSGARSAIAFMPLAVLFRQHGACATLRHIAFRQPLVGHGVCVIPSRGALWFGHDSTPTAPARKKSCKWRSCARHARLRTREAPRFVLRIWLYRAPATAPTAALRLRDAKVACGCTHAKTTLKHTGCNIGRNDSWCTPLLGAQLEIPTSLGTDLFCAAGNRHSDVDSSFNSAFKPCVGRWPPQYGTCIIL